MELWRQAIAARSGQDGRILLLVTCSECLRDDKFGSAILIAGLFRFCRPFAPRAFSGLTSEPKVHHWVAMDAVVIITSVKNTRHVDHLENSKSTGEDQWDSSPHDASLLSDSLVVSSCEWQEHSTPESEFGVSARGHSINGLGGDWGILGTASKKAVFWNAVVPSVARCGAQDVGTERGGGGGVANQWHSKWVSGPGERDASPAYLWPGREAPRLFSDAETPDEARVEQAIIQPKSHGGVISLYTHNSVSVRIQCGLISIVMCHVITIAARTHTSSKQPRNVYRIRRLDGMFLESGTGAPPGALLGNKNLQGMRRASGQDEATPARPCRLPTSALQ
ncbi:hypothetical protein V496_09657 [Pseudogymnoascus sp. VKM F-4515 (FW-2607)]|nr:hypothetical protein V496_09657 [Pseudogymnoascus sp. VKM F-4515 (FW-2607)]